MMVGARRSGWTTKENRVSHMVIYRSADGKAAFQQVDDLNAAVAFVEKIRNEAGVENSRIYRMELVNYRFEPYYQVRLDGGEMPGGPPGRVAAPSAPTGAGAPGSFGAPPTTPAGSVGASDRPMATGSPGPGGVAPEPAAAGAGSVPPAGGPSPSSSSPSSPAATAATAVDPADEAPGGSRSDESRGGAGNGTRRGLFGR
jgi:hypothetical protein